MTDDTEIPCVLFVDDNVNLLSAIRRMLRKKVTLKTAESAVEALDILETDPRISVVVADQNMPQTKGVEFLAQVARRWPLVARVMQTGNADQETAMAAINAGRVFRFIRKPYEPEQMLAAIQDAHHYHQTKLAERELLQTTLAGSIKLLSDLLSHTRPHLFAKATRVQALAKKVTHILRDSQAWELDLAAMLYPMGLIFMPKAVASKFSGGLPMSEQEQLTAEQSAQIAAKLIGNIPKLENVGRYVALARRGFDGSGIPLDGPKGVDIPEISRLLRILIDLVDQAESRDKPIVNILPALRARGAAYDLEMLAAIADTLESDGGDQAAEPEMQLLVAAANLRAGDQLARDVVSVNGNLLLAAGAILSAVNVQRLVHFARVGEIAEDIHVIRGRT